jgi:hypothetical protein
MMHISSANFFTRSARFLLMAAALTFGLLPLTANVTAATTDAPRWHPSVQLGPVVAQDSDSNDETGVSPDQLEKYVAVYRAMQHDRGLTVESAAAKQNLTLSQFRELEQKVERDEIAREQVRRELQAAAKPGPAAASIAAPAKP